MPSNSDHLQHPHHFDFSSAAKVPDTHTWTNLNDHPSAESSGPDAVPVVDLSSPDAAALVGLACDTWGLFQVTGHGIPTQLLDGLDTQIRRLFSLPTERKLRAARSSGGIAGYGLAPLSSFFSKFMWSEGFTVAGSPLDYARRLWPLDYHQFCDVVEEYGKAMEALVHRLMKLMLISLGLTEEDVKWAGPIGGSRKVSAALQLNWYPACPDPDRAMGLAAHTDSGLLTVLYQSSGEPGLQALRPEDRHGPARWVGVPPLPGALVVNVGDLAHILSNGRFLSVVHRAVVNRAEARLSAAYICGPPAHVKVSPVVRGSPSYRAVTWPEYRGLKARLFDQALASIKVSEEDHNSVTSVISCI